MFIAMATTGAASSAQTWTVAMPSFTVNKAEFKKKFDGKKGGTFAVYTVELKDEQGFTNAELVQKEETPAPKQGDVLEGTLEPTDYGMKFKRAQSFGGKGGGKSPQERAEIRRLAAQKAAVQLLGIEVQIALAQNDEHSAELFAKLREKPNGLSRALEARIVFFEKNAIAAVPS